MTKRRMKFTAAAMAVVCIVTAVLCSGIAFSADETMFKNNTPTYIEIGADIKGVITSSKDYEAYVFDVSENGALTLCLEHEDFMDTAKSGWIVTLYKLLSGANGEVIYKELSVNQSFWADVTSDWKSMGVTPGTYCVTVTPGLYLLDSEFTFKTTFTSSDNYEKEPNDVQADATAIAVGYGKYGMSSNRNQGTDIDWYKFDLAKDSCVNISFTHPDGTFPTVGWTITLINEQGDKITQFTSRKTDLILRTGVMGLKEGRYYISVEAQSDSADEYTLLVGSDKAVNFEFEINDKPEQAIALPEGIGISGSLSNRLLSLDKDYYKFTVSGEGYVNIDFTHNSVDGDKNGWNIRVLKELPDGTFTEIVRKVSKWNESITKIQNLGLPAGDYYLLIDGDSVSYTSETYTVEWNHIEKENFEREPNSSMLNCQTIDINTYYRGAIISADATYDEDFYRFRLVDTKSVAVEFKHDRFTGSDACWRISIVDDKGNVKADITSALNQGIVSTGVVELPAGVYFVKIETGLYGSEVPYEFKLIG